MVPPLSRLNRREEKKQLQIIALAVIGTISLFAFLLIFGLKILIQFSVLLDAARGGSPISQTQQVTLNAPILDPILTATKSASLMVTAHADPGLTLIVYVNEQESKRVSMPGEGTITVSGLKGTDGTNTISAKVIDDKENISELSNVVITTVTSKPPLLELTAPTENATQNGDDNKVQVTGKTEEQNTITINDRFVVVNTNGSFSYLYPLNEGATLLKIIATDPAGNQTVIERTINYHK